MPPFVIISRELQVPNSGVGFTPASSDWMEAEAALSLSLSLPELAREIKTGGEGRCARRN